MKKKGMFMSGEPVYSGTRVGMGRLAVFFSCPLFFSFAITCVYLAMRGVMRLGGFVASGGPYAIAHPAPDYIWIVPLSIFLMMGTIFTSLASASKVGGPNIMSLSWSAIFLALGWNFVEFGFGIGMGGRPAIGWIICAVFFIMMGAVPLVFIFYSFRNALSRRNERSGEDDATGNEEAELSWGASILIQAASAAAGVFLGVTFFELIS